MTRSRRAWGAVGAVLLAAAGLAWGAGAAAEQKLPTEAKLKKLVEQRREVVWRALELDPAQKVAVAPVFDEYEQQREAQARLRLGVVDDFTRTPALSDAAATALLDRMFQLRRQDDDLDERFRPRFAAVLPPQKVLLLYQLNFILDAVVNYDLAGMIPLVK